MHSSVEKLNISLQVSSHLLPLCRYSSSTGTFAPEYLRADLHSVQRSVLNDTNTLQMKSEKERQVQIYDLEAPFMFESHGS